MAGFYGQLFDTVGMEYETTAYSRNQIMSDLENIFSQFSGLLNITNDASINFNASLMRVGGSRYLKVSEHTKAFKQFSGYRESQELMGVELVTSPMEMPKLEEMMYPFMYRLLSTGDFTSPRASIHLHTAFANNLNLLKKLLRVCLAVDPVLYRLGGMGGTFRGHVNNCAYARPLLNSVCVPIMGGVSSSSDEEEWHDNDEEEHEEIPGFSPSNGYVSGNLAQICNPLAALDATTIQEFWACFGVSYPQGGTIKYHPTRYAGTNFFSIPAHGTIEFRHLNQSLNPQLVISIAKFLRGMVEMSAFLTPVELRQFEVVNSNTQISMSDASNIVMKITTLCRQKELANLPSDVELALIMETLSKSTFKDIPTLPVMTHIKDFALGMNDVRKGKLKQFGKVFAPNNVDIHNISYIDLIEKE